MANPLAAKTAWRYLFARKSHSAVNFISNVAMCGIAVATMAMVCVLSVFNGFQDFARSNAARIIPDVLVSPAKGKSIASADSLASQLAKLPEVAEAMPAVTDNALLSAAGLQLPVTLLGVDAAPYERITGIRSILMPGSRYLLQSQGGCSLTGADLSSDPAAVEEVQVEEISGETFDESQLDISADALYSAADEDDPLLGGDDTQAPENFALVSIGVLQNLVELPAGIDPERTGVPPGLGVNLFVPRRTTAINLSNPASSFLIDSVGITGAFTSLRSEMDNNTVLIDINLARNLLEYTHEASQIYLKAAPGVTDSQLKEIVEQRLGPGFRADDRAGQQTFHQNMVRVEKWITFLLLSCILLIASFNVVSTVTMLIVEKKRGIRTLRCLGASRRTIGAVFSWESIYVCCLGAFAGILLGLALCLIQQHFGIISIGGSGTNLMLHSYPVKIVATDLLVVLAPVAVIALLTALAASRFAHRIAR